MCGIKMMTREMVMRNDRGDYLFYESSDKNVFFTLTDKHGNVIRSAELPISLDCFVRSMEKAGYRAYGDKKC